MSTRPDPAPTGEVTQGDREAYLSLNTLPASYGKKVLAGDWDQVTGVQAFRNHRLRSVAPLESEIARLRQRLELTGEFADGPDGIECRDDTIKLQDERIARQEATIAQLTELLDELQTAESTYRYAHDILGAGDRKTGRAWDLMRRAGDRARLAPAHFDAAGNHHPTPEAATIADIEALIGLPVTAGKILARRPDLERIFREHDEMLAAAGADNVRRFERRAAK